MTDSAPSGHGNNLTTFLFLVAVAVVSGLILFFLVGPNRGGEETEDLRDAGTETSSVVPDADESSVSTSEPEIEPRETTSTSGPAVVEETATTSTEVVPEEPCVGSVSLFDLELIDGPSTFRKASGFELAQGFKPEVGAELAYGSNVTYLLDGATSVVLRVGVPVRETGTGKLEVLLDRDEVIAEKLNISNGVFSVVLPTSGYSQITLRNDQVASIGTSSPLVIADATACR